MGGIFVVSGFLKIPSALDFAHNVASYQILPHAANILAAATLPWIELFCGLLLVVGYRVRACAFFTFALMLLFLASMGSAIWRGLEIDCGCFQPGKSEVPTPLWVSVVRDLGFLALSVWVLWAYRRGEDRLPPAS